MTTHDPTHLGALETGYDQGYDEALLAVNRQLRDAGLNPDDLFGDGVESGTNPYTQLRDDRRKYVHCALHSEPVGTARPCDCASNPGEKPENPQVDGWPVVDDSRLNAAQNAISRGITEAAGILGISHVKLSTRYGIAGRVVDEIRSSR